MSGTEPADSSLGRTFKKPMARVTRVTLFQREIRERLSDALFDVLLERAEVISEGQVVSASKYYGSTMLTLDLADCGALFREVMDGRTADRLVAMLRKDRRVAPRLKVLARAEAERVAGARLTNLEMEIKVDARGARVLVDLDVEGSVASASRHKDAHTTPAGLS